MIEWATATNKAIAPMEFPDALHYLMKDQKMTVEHLEETSLIEYISHRTMQYVLWRMVFFITSPAFRNSSGCYGGALLGKQGICIYKCTKQTSSVAAGCLFLCLLG